LPPRTIENRKQKRQPQTKQTHKKIKTNLYHNGYEGHYGHNGKLTFEKAKTPTTNTNTPFTTMYPKYPRAKTSPIPVTNHKLVAMLESCPFQRNGPKFPKLRKVKNNSGYGKTNSTQTSIQHDEHSKPISQNQSKRMMRHVPFKSVRNKRSVLWGRVRGRGIPFPGDFQKASTPPQTTCVYHAEHKQAQTIKTDLALRLKPSSPNTLSQNQPLPQWTRRTQWKTDI
jgi:hypothetical protein